MALSSTFKWAVAGTSLGTVLSTHLNALANDARSTVGAEYDNSTGLYSVGWLQFLGDFAVSPSAGGYLQFYMVRAPDGTNYEDGSDSVDPGNHRRVAVLPVRATTDEQRLVSLPFELPPYKVKFICLNESGQALASNDGNVVTLYAANEGAHT